ncbi:MAG: UbiA family prenyltransferase [Rhodospirillales bacterium]|nr:UbiA family prenyltransferase [Rhodospirillales bacterium]
MQLGSGGGILEQNHDQTKTDVDEISIPLVIDLDGTLIKSDLLIESFFFTLAKKPADAIRALAALPNGKAPFKAILADQYRPACELLPVNEELLAFAREQKQRGRKLYLATASDSRLADLVASHFGLFDGVFATNSGNNLTGHKKAEMLLEKFGDQGFDYAGDRAVDLPVWKCARRAIVVNASRKLIATVRAGSPSALAFDERGPVLLKYIKALRIHQWLKNVLILIPGLAAHELTGDNLIAILTAFLAFSFCASSVYLLNDLIDLPNDRAHNDKRRRPFASGSVPLQHGMIMIPSLLGVSVVLAFGLSYALVAVLALYYMTTIAYMFVLKRSAIIDVCVLSLLYTLRLAAGSAVTGIQPSSWLLTLSLFFFLSLAVMKRINELSSLPEGSAGKHFGRGYLTDDIPVLTAMAAASGYAAVLVFVLYLSSPKVNMLYANPQYLWLISPIFIFWISRTLLLAHRGELHEDPLVFALRDKLSLLLAGLCAAIMAAAIYGIG